MPTISTDANYVDTGHVANDTFTITSGAVLTIDTTTLPIRRFDAISIGGVFINNPSTTTPIFIRIGNTSPAMRFEGAGKITARGERIIIGTSNGTAGQTFALPTDASGNQYTDIAQLQGFIAGMAKPLLFNNCGSLTDMFGDEVLGAWFTHDTVANTVTFGDGTNGYIPPSGMQISVANIQFQNTSTGTVATDYNSSGQADLENVLFDANFNHAYTGASEVRLKGVGIWNSGSSFVFSTINGRVELSDFSYANTGLTTVTPLFERIAGLFTIDNAVFSDFSGGNRDFLDILNIDGATFTDMKAIKGGAPFAANTYAINPQNLTSCRFDNLVTASSLAIGLGFIGGSANTVNGHKFNCAGKRNEVARADRVYYLATTSGNTITNFEHWPKSVAEGLVAPSDWFVRVWTACFNNRVYDGEFYAGPGSTDQVWQDFSANSVCANLTVVGQVSGQAFSQGTGSSNLLVQNVISTEANSIGNTNDNSWGNGTRFEYAFTADSLSLSVVGEGADVASLMLYDGTADRSKATLFRAMGPDLTLGLYTEVTKTGFMLFGNNALFYMQNAGDVAEFQTRVHRGILGALGVGQSWSNSADFAVTVAIRNPGGTYSAFFPFTVADFNAALAALTGYDSTVGLQVKFRLEKVTTGTNDWVRWFEINCDIDPNHRETYAPTNRLTLNTLKENSEVRVYAAGTTTELAGIENSGTSFTANVPVGALVDVVVFSLGYQPIRLLGLDMSERVTIPIQQVIDRVYANS